MSRMWSGFHGLDLKLPKSITYYPPPVSRLRPSWMFDLEIGLSSDNVAMIAQLLNEVYAASRGGQYIDWP